MMLKGLKVPFNQVSNTYHCKSCGKAIKINMLNRKLDPPAYCYGCWVSREYSRGHIMQGAVRERVGS